MIKALLTHKIRKDLLRKNKKYNHKQYLSSLVLPQNFIYQAGYHKKKIIFLIVLALVGWTYSWHRSLYYYVLSMRSPYQFIANMLVGSEKVEKTIHEQKLVGWPFTDKTKQLLTKLYVQADKQLIFGFGRNYLYQIFTQLGLLKKDQDIRHFWIQGGFYKKRNQIVSGVGYNEFMILYREAFYKVKQLRGQISQQEFLKQFMEHFINKFSKIKEWQIKFNKDRHNQLLKNIVGPEAERKKQEIYNFLNKHIDCQQKQLDSFLNDIGLKGMTLGERYIFWQSKYILFSLRQSNYHRRLKLSNFMDFKEKSQYESKLLKVQQELKKIQQMRQWIKTEHQRIYEQKIL